MPEMSASVSVRPHVSLVGPSTMNEPPLQKDAQINRQCAGQTVPAAAAPGLPAVKAASSLFDRIVYSRLGQKGQKLRLLGTNSAYL